MHSHAAAAVQDQDCDDVDGPVAAKSLSNKKRRRTERYGEFTTNLQPPSTAKRAAGSSLARNVNTRRRFPAASMIVAVVAVAVLSPPMLMFGTLTLLSTTTDAFAHPFPQRTRTLGQSSSSRWVVNKETTVNSVMDDLWNAGMSEEQKDVVGAKVKAKAEGEGEEFEANQDPSSTLLSPPVLALGGAAIAGGALTFMSSITDMDLGEMLSDPSRVVETVVSSVETMGDAGILYFGATYVVAEILAIPAVPIMTASSGYLFGTLKGTIVCLSSASIAAAVSFIIGRTVLRGYVEAALEDNPKFTKIDKAVGKDGFKLMLLLRLSPVFPFALSNYLYGASSIRFWPYFFGTMLGFAPGTFAYVYAGRIGKALTLDGAESEPWYVYLGGFAVLVALLKVAADVAAGVIDAIEDEEENL